MIKLIIILTIFLTSCITITKNYYPKEVIKETVYIKQPQPIDDGLQPMPEYIDKSRTFPKYVHPIYKMSPNNTLIFRKIRQGRTTLEYNKK